jgi:hypothetical protein
LIDRDEATEVFTMPYHDPDATDPMTLHGVAVDVGDDGALRAMAECFVEEYVRLGFSASRLMQVFRNPGYAGPHLAYRAFGEAWVAELIAEHLALRGPSSRPGVQGATHEQSVAENRGDTIRLRVLDI